MLASSLWYPVVNSVVSLTVWTVHSLEVMGHINSFITVSEISSQQDFLLHRCLQMNFERVTNTCVYTGLPNAQVEFSFHFPSTVGLWQSLILSHFPEIMFSEIQTRHYSKCYLVSVFHFMYHLDWSQDSKTFGPILLWACFCDCFRVR